MRGGVSGASYVVFQTTESSPRAWGCFLYALIDSAETWVFPTCVGVFLGIDDLQDEGFCLPHVRGGVSPASGKWEKDAASSPRAWGCFSGRQRSVSRLCVFPTCVGVFPCHGNPRGRSYRLPHVRGGVSPTVAAIISRWRSSPRAWGCFLPHVVGVIQNIVFPTCVGVFRICRDTLAKEAGLPHVRGGVSRCRNVRPNLDQSSPRAWGCFYVCMRRLFR